VKSKTLTLAVLTIAMLFLAFSILHIKTVKAQSSDYVISRVNHTIQFLSNGHIFVNDTIQINGTVADGFLIGFPSKYGAHVVRCLAYNSTHNFKVNMNVPLEDRIGYYGVEVKFSHDTPQLFTVGFVLSNSLLTQDATNTTLFTLDFPAYPSLTKDASICNGTIALKNVGYVSGTISSFSYSLSPNGTLPAFTYEPATVTFQLSGTEIQLFEIKELRREIQITGIGDIEGSDTYLITSKSPATINSFEVVLPRNASKVTAQDQFGRKLSPPTVINTNISSYKVALLTALKSYESSRFTVKYALPAEIYKNQKGSDQFDFSFVLFQNLNSYVEQAFVSFALPEGAKISSQNASALWDYGVSRGVFQETVTIKKQGVISYDKFTVQIAYEYNLLWLSFRTTLWMWALTIVGCAIVFVSRRPETPSAVVVPKAAVGFGPEIIKSFVDSYEEKRKITAEIKTLEAGVRKGKIPRRRYKVQRRISETRLDTLENNLQSLRQKLRAMGGRYLDLMHQLEVAETEINEVEANIESIEARHRRGDLSLEAYRKLFADYERRREKAETTISGILIRLREEIR